MIRRLRSREGCDRCRIRRKKCDEHRPICHACSRWNLMCTWSKRDALVVGQESNCSPAQAQISYTGEDSQLLITRLPALSCHQNGTLANGYQTFSGDREFYLASTCPLILSYILNPSTTGHGRDTSRFTSLVLLDPCVRAAWVAFAAKMLTFQDSLPGIARQSYHSAVVGTRRALENHRDPYHIFSLAAAILFMGFYEIYGNGDPDLVFTHVTAILILASDLLNKHQLILSQSEHIFLKLSIEWAFFAAANTAIYQLNLGIFRQINWSILNSILNDGSTHCANPCRSSPLLHGKAEIFSIFCQIAALARQPCSDHVQIQMAYLARRLKHIEPLPQNRPGDDVTPEFEKMFTLRWPFLVRSVRIYMLKVVSRAACSGVSSIRTLVDQSLSSLRLMRIDSRVNPQWAIWPLPHSARQFGVHRNQGMFWHLSIFMCAIHENESLYILEERTQSLVGMIPWRHHNKMEKCREIIRARKRDNLTSCTASSTSNCTVPHDGLDFLLRKDGIFGILDKVDEAIPSP